MTINSEGTHITLRMEEISYAYINALASVCGYAAQVKHRFMDHAGLDISIEVPGEIYDCLSPIVDAQVKCTSSNCMRDGQVHFKISSKTYERLRYPNPYKKQFLVVVLIPKDLSRWIAHGRKLDRKSTIVRASAYWLSLEGWPEINQSYKTVCIPVSNRLTSETIKLWMAEAAISKEKP